MLPQDTKLTRCMMMNSCDCTPYNGGCTRGGYNGDDGDLRVRMARISIVYIILYLIRMIFEMVGNDK